MAVRGAKAYVAFIDYPRHGRGASSIRLATFSKGFSRPTFAAADDYAGVVDKPSLAVDGERLVLAWIRRLPGGSRVMFASSSDGARFTRPVRVAKTSGLDAQGVQLLALGANHLVIVFSVPRSDNGPATLIDLRSNDNGNSWSRARSLGEARSFRVRLGRHRLRTADFFPALASDSDGHVAAATQTNRAGHGQILVETSNDYGRSWYAQFATPAGAQAFTPTLAFDARDRLGLSYYILKGGSVTRFFVVAKRSGETFDPGNRTVIGGPASVAHVLGFDGFLGDYEALAVTPTGFVAAFALPTATGARIETRSLSPGT